VSLRPDEGGIHLIFKSTGDSFVPEVYAVNRHLETITDNMDKKAKPYIPVSLIEAQSLLYSDIPGHIEYKPSYVYGKSNS
jgi:hypothetical protein